VEKSMRKTGIEAEISKLLKDKNDALGFEEFVKIFKDIL
jgi:hypothetical protein